jgi:hypothetical protein
LIEKSRGQKSRATVSLSRLSKLANIFVEIIIPKDLQIHINTIFGLMHAYRYPSMRFKDLFTSTMPIKA